MRKFVLAMVGGLVVWSQVAAEGLVYRLPPDGTSARFDLTFDAKGKTLTGSLVMSSVGQTTVDGEKCRWLEFKTVLEGETNIAKVLIPEKHLKAGANPGEKALKIWVKRGKREAEELADLKDKKAGPAPVLLSGPYQNVKKLAKEAVDKTPLGKGVECAGVTGTNTFDQGKEKITITFEDRLHDMAPFGVVTSRMTFKITRDDVEQESGVLALRLTEIGKNAQSELPDAK